LKGLREVIHVHEIDASGDKLDRIAAQAQADIAFHLATFFVAEHAPQDVQPLIDANILFPCRLVDVLVRNGTRRLVNCSSAWQHFENRDYSPVSLYSATKRAFLALLTYYVEATDLSVIDLTISDTYGPDDRRPKLFPALYRACCAAEPLAFSPGEQFLDLVYVDDVIDALMIAAAQLLEKEQAGLHQFALHGECPMSLKDVVTTFANVTGLSPKIAWGARPYRKREMMTPWSGGKTLPGWKPAVGIEEGVRRMHARHILNSGN
jgi:nucleoside-diphosphate-sugar epimerase